MEHHSKLVVGDDRLIEGQHSDNQHEQFSLTLVETLAELLHIDPTEQSLHLNEHVHTDSLDRAYRHHEDNVSCTCVSFQYGGYSIACCSCGTISIYGDKVAHQEGRIELPASMRGSVGHMSSSANFECASCD